jgi:hypothetical protein
MRDAGTDVRHQWSSPMIADRARIAEFAFAAACVLAVCGTANASDTFSTIQSPGGGTIVTAALGNGRSLQASIALVLRHIHTEFGQRPNVVNVAENTSAHSATLFFNETKNGKPYSGMAVVSAVPGTQAAGAVLYDTTARFGKTLGPMLGKLGSVTTPSRAPAAARPAPAEPLQHHVFADGTGSIDVPADWKLTNGGGGSASGVGPTGEIVTYDLALSAMEPTNATAINYLRGLPPQYRQLELQRTAMLGYTGNPESAWTTAFGQLAKQNGKTAPVFHVASAQPIGSNSGLHLEEITGTGTIPGIAGKSDSDLGQYVAYVQVTPPNTMGQWTMYSTFVFVPERDFNKYAATAAAIIGSVRINFGAVAAQSAAIRQMFPQKFETMIANAQAADAARQARTDAFLANDAAAQDGMHKQAVAMENFARDQTTVVDATTGAHSTVGSSFASVLVTSGSNYHVVPPSELISGVDY